MPSLSAATREFGQNKVGHTSVRKGYEFLYKLWLWQRRHAEKVLFNNHCLLEVLSLREKKRKIYCLVSTSDLLGWPLIGLCHCCLFCLSSDWLKLFSLPEGCFSTGQFIWLSPRLHLLHVFTSGLIGLQTASVLVVSQNAYVGLHNCNVHKQVPPISVLPIYTVTELFTF